MGGFPRSDVLVFNKRSIYVFITTMTTIVIPISRRS
ncbi:unnamed protein product [Phytomonas sp. Hart1]|nr:unnamed protein product [Phytomonas sp. Hart1]|eukprot:CCW69024.1 unnamed protein product [Phytomonas sp. isolate Hart1]